ncbi:hypothetical protein Bca4012_046630 [Brassica carinata]
MVRFLTIAFIPFLTILFVANVLDATELNVMDKCWRPNPHWRKVRNQLARCSVGFAGKMTGNIGKGVTQYKVTDPSDDPLNPKPGTLRYAATLIKGKKWITFKRNMKINLHKPLLISSFTTLDGRGVSVHISGPACLIVYKATDVIIHGLKIHDCKAHPPSSVMGPDSKIMELGQVDGDAIRLYAIGGSMSPRVKSESNYFVAPESGRKEITWKKHSQGDKMQWNFYSVNDYMENGACFGLRKGIGKARPNYGRSQRFTVADAKTVKKLTSSAGALHCTRNSVC